MAREGKGVGLVGADKSDVHACLDGGFLADGPEDAVDEHAAVVGIEDVFGSALGGVEDAMFFAILAGVVTSPSGGDRRFGFVRGVVFVHADQRLGVGEDGEVGAGNPVVGAGVAEGIVSDAGEDDVGLLIRDDLDTGALRVVLAVVTDPGIAEDLVSEAVFVSLDLGFEIIFCVGGIGGNFEGVGRGAKADNGAATVEVRDDVIHLFAGEIEETSEDDEEVCALESLQAGDVGDAGLDVAVLVDAVEDGAFETVVFGQDPGEGGAGFLGAVFVVAGEEDDVLACAGAGVAFVDERGGLG